MRRDPAALVDGVWDVVVVGGGIYGACLAWEAVLRGLTVCLLEQRDFASGASANTMKIIHGGLRSLQHLDGRRMRDAMRERRALLRIAPHLVRPLPVLVPTYGVGLRGRGILRAALLLNDLLGLDRNRGLDAEHRIPRGRTISREECVRRAPVLEVARLSGAGIFHDAQVYSSERLVLAFLRSAAKAGAEIANDVEVVDVLKHGHCVAGVRAVDRLDGDVLTIRGRAVVNAAGAGADLVLRRAGLPGLGLPLARAMNVVTRRSLAPCAFGVPTPTTYRDRRGRVHRGSRMLFVVPWRDRSLVGTWYALHNAGDEATITEADVADLLREVDAALPALDVSLDDVAFVHAGLVPLSSSELGRGGLPLATAGRIVDHARDGCPGLVTVSGVKYTMARHMAERVVDRLLERLGRPPAPSTSAVVPLDGADGGRGSTAVDRHAWPARAGVDDAELRRLVRTYGSACGEVLAHADPTDMRFAVARAETRHAIRAEMAHTLGDVVFRRTEIGS
ncbi:MAG TPA: FAD-dependent oxidoreductase, partial [Candidatus Tectomicrobia bacterium]|nr:FAD-dependent oxidoreductase [Candidatus Tectomicrobia bacterium]